MILGQSMRVAVIGLLAGGAAAIAVSHWIQAGYHGIGGIDALFLVTRLLASALPAVRASRVNPVERLKA
jgi:ABC-type antimicrobial peptide transport system permease subunit